jgi:hypothetical protein
LFATAAVSAATHSAERIAAIAKLPNWSGVWQVSGSSDHLSGSKTSLPPYNAEWQAKFKSAQSIRSQDTAERYCAVAMPRLLGAAQPFEIIVTPEETLVYYSSREIRHLWTDGREHPPEDERWPMYWAESRGYWQGQTLVVDTLNIHGDLWIDNSGATLSDAATVRERISTVDKNHLRNEITITDPVAFTRPWSFTRTYQRQSATELTEQSCQWQAGKALTGK